MKSLKVLSLLCVCFLVCGSILRPVVSYASPYDLMISTDSNALMTMELDDSDYSLMPLSSLGSVTNTLTPNSISVGVIYYDGNGQRQIETVKAIKQNNRYKFSCLLSDDCVISDVEIWLTKDCFPNAGTYFMSFDYSSDFAYSYRSDLRLWVDQKFMNASSFSAQYYPSSQTYSGDVYFDQYLIDLGNIDQMSIISALTLSDNVHNVGGSFAIRFVKSNDSNGTMIGYDNTSADYQSGVSSSLSDLSSSVESVEEEISLVTQAIQTLQGAMEPHYDNVLTQLHHITEQLHAFYDQVYNNIHLPELDMLTQIRTAIENIDLQIEVDISEVKTAINNMSTAVQNKLQATTDQITGGFDNSQQTQQNQQLQDSINAYDEVEEDIFEDVDGFMQEFEYPSFDSMNGSVIKALAFIGGFLQSIFLSMGDFGTIITFSLTMIFVMIIVGYHRIRS